MKIDPGDLSGDALNAIVESFVLREGTDYGHRESDFRAKCDQVLAQLQRGTAWIDFDPTTDSIDIRPSD